MLIFKNRTYCDGSFFVYQQVDLATIKRNSASLPKKLNETIDYICAELENGDSEMTVSVSKLADICGVSTNAFSRRIRSLEAKKLIYTVPFKFASGLKKTVKCYVLNGQDLSNVATPQAISMPVTADQAPMSKQKIAGEVRKLEKVILNESFGLLPTVNNNTPIRHHGNFFIEQCISTSTGPQQSQSFSINAGYRHNVTVSVKSTSRIMAPDDLQTLYAVYTLIVEFHKNNFDPNKPLSRLTPVSVDDVRKLKGKKKSGRINATIRDSFECINDTTFQAIGSRREFETDLYLRSKFCNFDQCSPVTDEAPYIDAENRVIFGNNAMHYLIQLPEHVHDALLSGKYHFAFPPTALAAPGLVFLLYLRFRALVATSYTETLESLRIAVSPQQRKEAFNASLKTQLNKLNHGDKFTEIVDGRPLASSTYNSKNDILQFDLWGYIGSIDFKKGEILVRSDNERLITSCDVPFNNHSKQAPTKPNPLHRYYVTDTDKLPVKVPPALRKKVTVRRNKYSLVYKDIGMSVTKYCPSYDIESVTAELSDKYNVDQRVALALVNEGIAKLSSITICEHEINADEYQKLTAHFGIDAGIDTNEVILFLTKSRGMHKDILDFILNDEVSELLNSRFHDQEPKWKSK